MDWFEFFIYNVIYICGIGILQLFFVCRATGVRIKIWQSAIYLSFFYGVCCISAMLPFHDMGYLLNILLMYLVNRSVLKSSRSVSGVWAVLAAYVSQVSFGIMNPMLSLVLPLMLDHSFWFYAVIILSILLPLALCYGCYRLIYQCFLPRQSQSEHCIWLLLPPGIFLFAVEMYLLSANYGNTVTIPALPELDRHLTMLILQLLGIMVMFSSLYAYRRVYDGFQTESALASLMQETRAQKSYVVEAQARYENTRAFRHDVKNHLTVLDGFLKAGNIGQAQTYLQKLDAATGELSFPFTTGNPVVDILLENKLALCKANTIKLDVSLALPSTCVVTDLDWCVIFANALDNAIQACKKADAPGMIHIAGERQGDFYMMEFENTCRKERLPVPGFGIGLSNIKTVSEKYGGFMTVERKEGKFVLSILLNISIRPEDISLHND